MIADILDTSQTYRQRLRTAGIKFLLIGIPSIIMIYYDIEIIEILKLKKSKLSASITLYEE